MSYYPVSAQFERALRSSHTMISRLDVIRNNVTVTTFDFLDGAVTIDYDDRTRRSLDCEVIDPQGRTYDVMHGLVDPFLSQLRPWRGIKYPDGSTELVPMGTFFMSDVEAGEGDGYSPTWKLRAFDASILAQDELGQALAIANGSTYSSAVAALIRKVNPSASFAIASSMFRTPTLVFAEDSIPWTEAQDMGRDFGEDLTVDLNGTYTSIPRVVAANPVPAWNFIEGQGATSWEPKRSTDADRPVNVVEMIGTNPSFPGIYGLAFDNDKSSPTYRYGSMRERKKTFRSEKVTTTKQANAAARYLLSRLLGKTDQVSFSAVPNPALDVGDTVSYVRARMGLTGDRLILAHLEVPLVAERDMSVTARRSLITDGSEATPYLPSTLP